MNFAKEYPGVNIATLYRSFAKYRVVFFFFEENGSKENDYMIE